jgi:hypothetical protein
MVVVALLITTAFRDYWFFVIWWPAQYQQSQDMTFSNIVFLAIYLGFSSSFGKDDESMQHNSEWVNAPLTISSEK